MDLSINNLCRLCLKNSNFHSNIYKDRSMEDIPVYELVNDLCALGISVEDGLPEFLCCECFVKVEDFKTFKTNAHKGLSVLLLLMNNLQNPIVKQEELEISGDESEELVDATNTKPIFGPILLKNEMLTVCSDGQQQEEVIKSERLVTVDALESPGTFMEDSTQVADRCDSGSELCEEGALREQSSDDEMEPLILEPEDTDVGSTEVHVSLLDMGTHPQYLQTLECKRPLSASIATADADPCTHNISSDDESVLEISENNSLSVEFEASSNGKMKRSEGQWIQQGELSYMNPSLQEDFGNGKKWGRKDKDTGEGEEGLSATVPEKKLEGEECKCYHCGKVFTSKCYLIKHMKIHGFDHSCDCKMCMNIFHTKVNLKCHDSTHTCSKPYKCLECSKSFIQKSNLKTHMRLHTGEKPFKCAECSKCFSQSFSLKIHMRLHTGSKPFKCAECSKCFRQSSNLISHMRSHSGLKPYTCSECSKSFSDGANFKTHMRTHTGSKPFKCAECSKCFSQSFSLKIHMRLHTGSKPFKCAECSKCFRQSSNLISHMRSHSGLKPYTCSECSKSFSDGANFKTHMRTHTGSKPFKCAECSKCFSQSATLKTHMRSHTGLKPFKCAHCSKCFSQSATLKTHMRTHTGEKPYKCADCSKCFSHSSNLNKHLRLHSGSKR